MKKQWTHSTKSYSFHLFFLSFCNQKRVTNKEKNRTLYRFLLTVSVPADAFWLIVFLNAPQYAIKILILKWNKSELSNLNSIWTFFSSEFSRSWNSIFAPTKVKENRLLSKIWDQSQKEHFKKSFGLRRILSSLLPKTINYIFFPISNLLFKFQIHTLGPEIWIYLFNFYSINPTIVLFSHAWNRIHISGPDDA